MQASPVPVVNWGFSAKTKIQPARVFPTMDLAEIIESFGRALTIAEFCAIVPVSQKTVLRHIRAGKLPAYHIGSRVFLDPSKTAAWLRERLH